MNIVENWDSINSDNLPPDVKRMIDWIIEAADRKQLTLGQKGVLRKMLWLDREEASGCSASAAYLGRLLSMTARTVRLHRTALVKKGMIRKEHDGWFFVWPFDEFPPASHEVAGKTPSVILEWAAALNEYLATPRSKQVHGGVETGTPPRSKQVHPLGKNRYMGRSKQVHPYIRKYTESYSEEDTEDIREGSDKPSESLLSLEEPNTGEQTKHPENPAERRREGIPRGEVPDRGDAHTSGEAPAVKSRQPNWIAEAGEVWKAAYRGTVPYGRIGKALTPLTDDHTTAEILAAWKVYTAKVDGQFASPDHFANSFGKWEPRRELKELPDPLAGLSPTGTDR